jgi:hypothetical protein
MFQVKQGGNWIGYAGNIEGAREIVRCEPPGRYEVDEVRASSVHAGFGSRRWGQLIRHPDGRVEDEAHLS